MIECEKHINRLPILDDSSIDSISIEEGGFRKGWRAALEWLYGQLDYSIEHKQIKDIIEQELGENQ